METSMPLPGTEAKRYAGLREFYPFYLGQHSLALNRRLHFLGTSLLIGLGAAAIATRQWWWLALMPVPGYGFAWIGHFVFEKNKPATFTYPIYSLICDFRMYWDILRGRISL